MLHDLRYAVRTLRRMPVFTAAALLSLTLGIGSSAAIFSLVDAAMLRRPPFADADRLAVLNITQRTPREGELRHRWSWPRFQLLKRYARSFEGVATSSNNVVTVTGSSRPEPLAVEIVSTDYLGVMRAPLVSGRGFVEGDGIVGAPSSSVVIGYDVWQRRFGGIEDVVGSPLELNGIALTVVGVAARGFNGVSGLAQAWIPATVAPLVTYRDYLTTNQNFITVIGRLRRDVTIDSARAELAIVGARIHAEQASEADTPQDEFSATAMTLNDARIDVATRRALMLLGAAAALLLLIACANVAGLLVGRAAGRRREIAIRLAIGSDRARLVRQMLIEGGVLAAAAGGLTLVVTAWIMPFLRIPATLARGRNFYGAVGEFATPTVDWRLFAFTFAICACTVLLFALLPALRSTRIAIAADLKAGGGGASRGPARLALREAIVGLQVCLAVVLLVGCGLLLSSYARLRHTPLGFDPDGLVTFMIRPSEVKYDTTRAPALLDRVLEQIARVPGVEAATVDGCAPLSTQCANASLRIVGRPLATPADAPSVLRHYVSPNHFKTLRVPIIRGRGLEERDRAGSPAVVVINEAAAQRFWPDEDPIGKRVWFEGATAFDSPEASAEIVGIVGNVAYQPLGENAIQPDFFTAYAQFTYPNRMVLVRATAGESLALVPQLAQAVRRADPDLALFDVQTMAARAQLSWSKHSFQTALFAIIAFIALSVAATGVFAVTSFFVTSRSREIGIRLALGANAGQIARAMIGPTIRFALPGAAAGIAGALLLGRAMRAALYETSPLDPVALGGAVSVLIGAVIAAGYLPLRRALAVNPVDVLRSE
ncbi:MAG TPA: ADOP family duplicated permease [Vicinamibacterales bacterium]|nr:ADOP family duplicated permease [Vicinamibacterales bacterium]